MIHSLLLHARPPRQSRAVAVPVRRDAGDQVELAERSTQLHVARRHEALGDGRRELLFRHDPSHDVRSRRLVERVYGVRRNEVGMRGQRVERQLAQRVQEAAAARSYARRPRLGISSAPARRRRFCSAWSMPRRRPRWCGRRRLVASVGRWARVAPAVVAPRRRRTAS